MSVLNFISDTAHRFSQVCMIPCFALNSNAEIVYQTPGDNHRELCQNVSTATGEVLCCSQVHYYGSTQAMQFGGKYIYYCSLGLIHLIATVVVREQFIGAIVAGPLIIADKENYLQSKALESYSATEIGFEALHSLASSLQCVSPERVTHLLSVLRTLADEVQDTIIKQPEPLPIIEAFEHRPTTPYVKHRDAIFKALTFINSHLSEKITLDDVANAAFLSPTYFSKIFKNEMNVPFSQYLNETRIEKSKDLLIHTNLPVSEICIRVGFEEQSYFTKVFKRMTAQTPLHYRDAHLATG